jgi:hypothetical protein
MTQKDNNGCNYARHPDFEKIHAAFLQHYSKDPAFGEARYVEWVKLSGLDENQSYYAQGAARAEKSKQSFEWAKFLLQFVKEDQDARYYKVEALFPVESMNGGPPFTRDEILQAARSLTGKPSNLNHDGANPFSLIEVEVVAAQFEDDCVECLVRVLKSSPLIGMIDRKEIVSVSIEGEWSHGVPGFGLVLTGLGWLTKETTLPGIPLTRIMPVERIVESFDVNSLGVGKLEEKDMDKIAEKVAVKLGEKESSAIEKLRSELGEAKTKQAEVEGKLKVAEGARDKALGDLSASNKTVEDLKKLVPGVDLLSNPQVLMPIAEHIAALEKLLPPAVAERSTMGMQILCQAIRSAILKAKEKLKAK